MPVISPVTRAIGTLPSDEWISYGVLGRRSHNKRPVSTDGPVGGVCYLRASSDWLHEARAYGHTVRHCATERSEPNWRLVHGTAAQKSLVQVLAMDVDGTVVRNNRDEKGFAGGNFRTIARRIRQRGIEMATWGAGAGEA